MAAMGSMGSRARLWLDTPSMALKQVLLMNFGGNHGPNSIINSQK